MIRPLLRAFLLSAFLVPTALEAQQEGSQAEPGGSEAPNPLATVGSGSDG